MAILLALLTRESNTSERPDRDGEGKRKKSSHILLDCGNRLGVRPGTERADGQNICTIITQGSRRGESREDARFCTVCACECWLVPFSSTTDKTKIRHSFFFPPTLNFVSLLLVFLLRHFRLRRGPVPSRLKSDS